MLNSALLLVVFICMIAFSPMATAESCHSHGLSSVGDCKRSRRAVREQLRGIEPQQASPPAGMDTSLLATQLSGTLSVGEVFPITDSPYSDWLLLAYPSSINPVNLAPTPRKADQQPTLVAAIRWSQPAPSDSQAKPTATVLALTKNALIPEQAVGDPGGEQEAKSSPGGLYCVIPKNKTEGSDPGRYSEYSKLRWMQLSPKRRVLVATISRSEGYASGGGSFEAELLVDAATDGSLRPIACYATKNFQMVAGEWNQDGTRNHAEYQAGWKLVIDRNSHAEWPRLRLLPTTRQTSGATLVWSPQRHQYVEYVGY